MDQEGLKPDVITYLSILNACASAGALDWVKEAHRHALEAGLEWDVRVGSALTHMYAKSGSIDNARLVFDRMKKRDVITWTVMIKACSESGCGQLKEAKLFIGDMPVAPNGATWGACLVLVERMGMWSWPNLPTGSLSSWSPKDFSPFVLLSNIYAAAGMWEVSLMRTMMQERGIRKEAGHSWIEVDNKIHSFVVGDKPHPEAKEIKDELHRLSERIKAEGYVSDTRLVLQNIDEEYKELALCSHSEKLAIAYGLLRLPDGQPIHEHKNLQVCSDSHIATKFISKVTKRDIKARDAIRIHHFKDSACS